MDYAHTVELVHRIVGYPLAFIVAPIALATYTGLRGHRIAGQLYFYLMTFLYLTGLFMTFTHHEHWLTWNFARSLAFNFLGYSFVLYAYRAIYLFYKKDAPRPTRLDYALACLLTLSVAFVFSVAVWKNTAMRVFTIVGIVLLIMEWRELLRGFQPVKVLYLRHIRYVLASYFYVLTVVSIVHLNELPSTKLKWLWPTAIGAIVIYFATATSNEWLRRYRGRALRWAVMSTLVVALAFGAYATYELLQGEHPTGQQPRSPAMQTAPPHGAPAA